LSLPIERTHANFEEHRQGIGEPYGYQDAQNFSTIFGPAQQLSSEKERYHEDELRDRRRQCVVGPYSGQKCYANPDWILIEYRCYEGTDEEDRNQDLSNAEAAKNFWQPPSEDRVTSQGRQAWYGILVKCRRRGKFNLYPDRQQQVST
jgi:hypothetical protein